MNVILDKYKVREFVVNRFIIKNILKDILYIEEKVL